MSGFQQPSQNANASRRLSLSELLMLLVVLIAVLSAVLVRPHRQRRAVDEIRRLGGHVSHAYGEDGTASRPDTSTWLRTLFGPSTVRVTGVYLSGSLITDSDLDILSTFGDMRTLCLDETRITDAALLHLVGLTQLKELSLQGTATTNEGLAALCGLPNLHTLHLDNTRVTVDGLVFLQRMPNLKRVTMLGLDLNSQDLADPDAINRKLRFLSRSDVVSDPRVLNEIVQAWEARQASVHALAVEYEENLQSGISLVTVQQLLSDSQGRSRVSTKGELVVDKAPYPLGYPETIELFDGKCFTRFYPKSVSGYPAVFVSRRSICWYNEPRFLPLALVCRPLHKPGGGVLEKESVALTHNVDRFDGQECIGLYHAEGMIWVSPSHDYLPMRYSCVSRGVTRRDIRIAYRHDEEHGWVPASWEDSEFDEVRFCNQRREVTVREYRINEPIADSAFQMTYPPDTLFTDQTTNETYVVRNDGTRMSISPSEHASRVRELLDSASDGHSPTTSDERQ